MNRRELVEFVNMCMIKNGDKVLVQDRVSSDWPGITFSGGHVERGESLPMQLSEKSRKKLVWPFPDPNFVESKTGTTTRIIGMSSSFTKQNTLLVNSSLQTKGKFGGRILTIYLI